jgi:hypothetical protein
MLSFAVVFDSSTAIVSRLADSSEAIRVFSVSTSEVDVVEEDFRVWSSLSMDERVFSTEKTGQ